MTFTVYQPGGFNADHPCDQCGRPYCNRTCTMGETTNGQMTWVTHYDTCLGAAYVFVTPGLDRFAMHEGCWDEQGYPYLRRVVDVDFHQVQPAGPARGRQPELIIMCAGDDEPSFVADRVNWVTMWKSYGKKWLAVRRRDCAGEYAVFGQDTNNGYWAEGGPVDHLVLDAGTVKYWPGKFTSNLEFGYSYVLDYGSGNLLARAAALKPA